jgi:hypothetical protein
MALKLPSTLMTPAVPKIPAGLLGWNGYLVQIDRILKDYVNNVYRAMSYLIRSTTFNATTDWGTAAGGYYTFTFAHNMDLTDTFIQVFDTTTGEDAVMVSRARIVDKNTISIQVVEIPDSRFVGKVVVIGL